VSAQRWGTRPSWLAQLARWRTGNPKRRPSEPTSAAAARRRRWLIVRLMVALAAVTALGAGGWLWLRDSSLVSVRRVIVTGEGGPDARAIRAALVAAARTMTTLDVKRNELLTAVAPYPVVKNVLVSTAFPHEMRIRVVEQIPIGAIIAGGRKTTVAADGTLLVDAPAQRWFPLIPLRVPPGGTQVTDAGGRAAVAMLAAAPYGFLGKVARVSEDSTHGLSAQLRGGPKIYFGDSGNLPAKWSAALAVLAAPGSAGAAYIDVTDPQRPASGVGGD